MSVDNTRSAGVLSGIRRTQPRHHQLVYVSNTRLIGSHVESVLNNVAQLQR